MTKQQILWAYVLPVFLMVFVGVFTFWNGDTANTILQKVLFTPFFLLATKGLRTYFPQHNDASRSFATQLEYQFLNALLLAVFVAFCCIPEKSQDIKKAAFMIAFITISMTMLNMFWFWRNRQKSQV